MLNLVENWSVLFFFKCVIVVIFFFVDSYVVNKKGNVIKDLKLLKKFKIYV